MALSKFLDPKNDVAFRKVFGSEQHKDIVIHFINDILELKGNDQIENVDFLSPIQDPEIASKKQSIVDVLCRAKSGVQIIVEMQVAPTKGFEKRAQYYAAKAYSRQLNKGNEEDGKYYNLKEVIFIAIASCIIFPDKKEYKSDHVILDKNSYEHNLKDFYFTFIELPKFKKNNIAELKTIVDKWCYFFKHAPETSEEDLINIIGSDLIIEKAYNALNQFNWSEPELLAYDEEIKRIRDNIAAMDYQYDKGKAEGENNKAIEIALNLLRQNLPLDIISSATGLSHNELIEFKAKL
jgi:predicted transposase/invertase (TIGR01784 family)